MAKEVDGFIFHVRIDEEPDIEIIDAFDNLTVNPGDSLTYQFIYQGGIGDGLSTMFNIFVYDRNDTTTDDVPAGTPDSPSASTADKPIPAVTMITPGTPLKGRPEITPTLIAGSGGSGIISTNNVWATLTSGVWIGWHKGSFEVVTPSSGYTEDITTFLGEAQIIFPDQQP